MGVQRDGDVGVPEALLYDPGVDAGSQGRGHGCRCGYASKRSPSLSDATVARPVGASERCGHRGAARRIRHRACSAPCPPRRARRRKHQSARPGRPRPRRTGLQRPSGGAVRHTRPRRGVAAEPIHECGASGSQVIGHLRR
jgi:hypothetical protein